MQYNKTHIFEIKPFNKKTAIDKNNYSFIIIAI